MGVFTMTTAKIAISMNRKTLQRLDRFVRSKVYKNRSQAIQAAVIQDLERLEHSRLARECAKLDRESEMEMAEVGILEDIKEWSKY